MLFLRLVQASKDATETRSRSKKTEILSHALRELGPEEIEAGVGFLSGELRQGRIGVGGARAWKMRETPPAAEPSLSVLDVDAAFERIGRMAGKGSSLERERALGELFARATSAEQDFLVRLPVGELRQGAQEGVMIEAVARAASLDADRVRRAVMLSGRLGRVAKDALTRGAAGLADYAIELFRPVGPMLAGTAEDVEGALSEFGRAALEDKLDGARVQLHKDGSEIRVFSRQLNDVTASVPELVELGRTLPAGRLILDGEALALRRDGRPQPFQVTMRRFGRSENVLGEELPLRSFFFDILLVDQQEVIDRPAAERAEALISVISETERVRRLVTADNETAKRFVTEALARGHEGAVLKSLDAPYDAGRRGGAWLKVKPAHTLDLVVLAVEYGSGRRQGWLSNLHLGARDPKTGGFVMLGKTFKGMTDAMLAWQTQHLRALAVSEEGHVVHVRPELVVEIAFDGIQKSSTYPGGLALRFARVKRYRTDKSALDADTIDSVRALHATGPTEEV